MDFEFPLLQIVLQALVHSLPSLLVSTVAVVILLRRRGPVQATLGFGLIGALALLIPAINGALAILHLPIASYSWIYRVVGVITVLAHAGAYVLILLGLLKLLPRPPGN